MIREINAGLLSTLPGLIDLLPVAVEIYDRDFRLLLCNPASDELFLYDPPILHHDDWWDVGFPDPIARDRARTEWHEKIDQARAYPDRIQTTEWSVMCRDSLMRIVRFQFRLIGDLYILVFWDVTEQRRQEENLRQLANSDPLTELLNRRHLFEVGEATFQQAATKDLPLSVLILDVDHFKSFNDNYGHRAGDAVLRAIAQRGSAAVAGRGIIGRIGGDEFAVLLPTVALHEVSAIAQRLCDAAGATPVQIDRDATALRVHLSVGGAHRLPSDSSLDGLMERADRALYAAKAGGRNCAVFDRPSENTNQMPGSGQGLRQAAWP